MTRSYRDPDSDSDADKPKVSGIQDRIDALSRYQDPDDLAVKPTKTEFGKRLVAFMIDVFVGYVFGLIVNMIPFVNAFVTSYTSLVFFLIIRDGLFDGRGIGKNLMGLQVVDLKTGEGIGLIQSFMRNIIIFGPLLVLFVVTGVLKLIPIAEVNAFVLNLVQLVGGVYTIIVLPYEAYRSMMREDGMRFGDSFAGTGIVEAPMDFSRMLKR